VTLLAHTLTKSLDGALPVWVSDLVLVAVPLVLLAIGALVLERSTRPALRRRSDEA
jgi:hypothetical protein